MIVLFTDFGLSGPYLGQVKAVLHQQAPGMAVIDLFSDAPSCNPRASAYLLAAYREWFAEGTVFLTVVDPGVGSERGALVVKADGHYFVGPDNGLLSIVMRRASALQVFAINEPLEALSASFHGRDLFAPVAAAAARSGEVQGTVTEHYLRCADWPDDLAEIVYIDKFGNAMTGIRASVLETSRTLTLAGRTLRHARTFSDVGPREGFWYENANGLVEIAVNQGHAAQTLGLQIGTPVDIGAAG